MKTKAIAGLLLLTLMIWGCENSEDKSKRESLLVQFNQSSDSADQAFDTMLKVETRKWFMVKRLADELEFFNLVDTVTLASLRQKLEDVKAIPYSPSSIAEEGLIDRYDAKTEEIVQLLLSLFGQQKGWDKYPILFDLHTEIRTLDERVVFMRLNYDQAAFRYNALLKEMSDSGHEMFKSSVAKGKRAVFQLGNPS